MPVVPYPNYQRLLTKKIEHLPDEELLVLSNALKRELRTREVMQGTILVVVLYLGQPDCHFLRAKPPITVGQVFASLEITLNNKETFRVNNQPSKYNRPLADGDVIYIIPKLMGD